MTRFDEYTRAAVRSQPEWVRRLFHLRKAFFEVSEDGELFIRIAPGLPESLEHELREGIVEYFNTHPLEGMTVSYVH